MRKCSVCDENGRFTIRADEFVVKSSAPGSSEHDFRFQRPTMFLDFTQTGTAKQGVAQMNKSSSASIFVYDSGDGTVNVRIGEHEMGDAFELLESIGSMAISVKRAQAVPIPDWLNQLRGEEPAAPLSDWAKDHKEWLKHYHDARKRNAL